MTEARTLQFCLIHPRNLKKHNQSLSSTWMVLISFLGFFVFIINTDQPGASFPLASTSQKVVHSPFTFYTSILIILTAVITGTWSCLQRKPTNLSTSVQQFSNSCLFRMIPLLSCFSSTDCHIRRYTKEQRECDLHVEPSMYRYSTFELVVFKCKTWSS